MTSKSDPDTLLAAFLEIEDELPDLVGESKWSTISGEFNRSLTDLRDSQAETIRLESCVKIMDILTTIEPARTRLAVIIDSLDMRSSVLTGIATIAEQINCTQTEIQEFNKEISRIASSSRNVTMKEDFTKAKTVKFGNLDFDFGDTVEIAANIIALVNATFVEKNSLLVAVGILLAASSLYKKATIDISEQDASVLWGLSESGSKSKTAKEDEILTYVNTRRERISLAPLSKEQVKNSLQKLYILGCVKPTERPKEGWKIIEKVKIAHR